jgi:hypothetical protein
MGCYPTGQSSTQIEALDPLKLPGVSICFSGIESTQKGEIWGLHLIAETIEKRSIACMRNENSNTNRDQWRDDDEAVAQGPPGLIDGARANLASQVARRAYFLYLEDGAQHGRDLAHWLQAEAELFKERAELRAKQPPLVADAPKQVNRQGAAVVL